MHVCVCTVEMLQMRGIDTPLSWAVKYAGKVIVNEFSKTLDVSDGGVHCMCALWGATHVMVTGIRHVRNHRDCVRSLHPSVAIRFVACVKQRVDIYSHARFSLSLQSSSSHRLLCTWSMKVCLRATSLHCCRLHWWTTTRPCSASLRMRMAWMVATTTSVSSTRFTILAQADGGWSANDPALRGE